MFDQVLILIGLDQYALCLTVLGCIWHLLAYLEFDWSYMHFVHFVGLLFNLSPSLGGFGAYWRIWKWFEVIYTLVFWLGLVFELALEAFVA